MNKIIPKISEQKQLTLLGCNFYGNPFLSAGEWSKENEIGKLWIRFGKNYQKYNFLLDKLNIFPGKSFEVHFEPLDYERTKKFEVFVGIAIEQISEEIPLEFVFKILPPSMYAEVTSYGRDYTAVDFLFSQWLKSPKSKYKQAYPYMIEYYDEERFNPLNWDDPTSEIDWWIPVVEK
jgi:predicted transcriptional regulator YdeE